MKHRKANALAAAWLCAAVAAGAASFRVECESFGELGGWVVDPDSMHVLGSSYVMAHGAGKPVADAVATVEAPAAGRYAVWAKTRDWADEWRGGRGAAPGRFKVVVGGRELPAALGAEGREWHWEKAGEVDLEAGAVEVALRDLTGFNGRCDALFFTDDLAETPPEGVPAAAVSDNPKEYDLIVCGGGIAGICMAQTAARYGLSTLLLQDRDVPGGCNSSEVRVGLGGRWHLPPYPNLGRILDEFAPAYNNHRPLPPEFYEDARKANQLFRSRRNLDAFYRERVFAVETAPGDPARIAAVLSRNVRTGAVTRHRAALFADATGDATVARLAGCETMYGTEPRSRFGESCAPEVASRRVMGHSTQWTSRVADAPVPFPDVDWGFALGESNALHITEGGWEQEAGQYRDMADDIEAIRDYGLYAVFSNWSYLKNRSPRKAEWANREITWISPVGGKRESHRVVGDCVLTQNDVESHAALPDLTEPVTWNIDIHYPDPDNEAQFGEPFRSCAYHRHYNGPYAVPYRCLYARDCENLFLAGRDISCSHVAFAATRVMDTLGVCGEVAGMAAAVCKKRTCTPRAVYAEHFAELKELMEKGAPPPPFYHAGGCNGETEFWHFKPDDEDSRPRIHPNPTPLSPGEVRKIKAIGVKHRHEHPQLADGAAERRRLVLADESRGRLHYYDSADPAACFHVEMEKPLWNLTRVGDGLYRTVCKGGFQIADLKARRIVDEFRHEALQGVTSICDLPDGGFLASVNPRGAKERAILVRRFSKERELVSSTAFKGVYNGRGLSRLADGRLLVAHEKGFAVCRLPVVGRVAPNAPTADGAAPGAPPLDGEIEQNVAMPQGRNLFEVVPNRAGTGYWAGAGYGAQLLRFDLEGNLLSAWAADQGEGKRNYFYAQPLETPDGCVYVANWTGHGADDSARGWQVVEFDGGGNVVWRLDDPARFGSIHGLDVIDAGNAVTATWKGHPLVRR